VARTLRVVGLLFVLCLACALVFRWAHQPWLWYPLLAILSLIAIWSVWLVSQTIPVTVLAMAAATAIAWLVTLGRNSLCAGPGPNRSRG
jgi:hypothetical protein